MEEAVGQAFSRIRDDIRELKLDIEKNAQRAEEAVKEARGAAGAINDDLTEHKLHDTKTFTKVVAALESITKEMVANEKRLWGADNDGTTGVIPLLQRSLHQLEIKIALGIGGGVVVVFILERFLHLAYP